MHSVSIARLTPTNKVINPNHFGGNIIHTRDASEGIPRSTFREAVDELGVTSLRFPAGQPDLLFENGMLINGGLPKNLKNFMDVSVAEHRKVVIVTPTFNAYQSDEQIREFAARILDGYPENILAFEIGNEFWAQQNEREYGEIANLTILALNEAIRESQAEAEIWIQMANAAGRTSSFNNANHDGDFETRTILANLAIQREISEEARQAIDGVVEHYYFNKPAAQPDQPTWQMNFIDLDYEVWDGFLPSSPSLNITEWNIKSSNSDLLGIKAAPTMLLQFEYMIDFGAATSFVWPPQHNTTNDLAGSEVVVVDPASGYVVNSVGGAIFDILSSNLVGLEQQKGSISGLGDELWTQLYSNEDRVEVFISSFSNGVSSFKFDIAEIWPHAVLKSGVIVGYNPETSDGYHFSPAQQSFVPSDYVMLDGQQYFLNEHDVQAQIKPLEISSFQAAEPFEIELKPFEVVHLTYTKPNGRIIANGNVGDDFTGTALGDGLTGSPSADHISGGAGDDTIYGQAGDDHIVGGSGSDLIFGGDGDDFLSGWGGDDRISGGPGNDTIKGFQGDDLLFGGSGNNLIRAGSGNDTILMSDGSDTAFGEEGDDIFVFAKKVLTPEPQVSLSGLQDFLSLDDANEITGIENFSHAVHGGTGYDTILLSENDDIIFLNSTISGAPHVAKNVFGLDLDSLMVEVHDVELLTAGSGRDFIDFNAPASNRSFSALTIDAGDGDDVVLASNGVEHVLGGEGNDWLFLGNGVVSATGGGGADTFFLVGDLGSITIHDYDVSEDIIDLKFLNEGLEHIDAQFSTLPTGGNLRVGELSIVITTASETPLNKDIISEALHDANMDLALHDEDDSEISANNEYQEASSSADQPVDFGNFPKLHFDQILSSASIEYVGKDGLADTFSVDSHEHLSEVLSSKRGGKFRISKDFNPNEDPEIGITDALNILRFSVGMDATYGNPNPKDYLAADINMNGRVDVLDALAVLNIALGFESSTPPARHFFNADIDLSSVSASNTRAEELTWLHVTERGSTDLNVSSYLSGHIEGW